jgi:hypothetical protein
MPTPRRPRPFPRRPRPFPRRPRPFPRRPRPFPRRPRPRRRLFCACSTPTRTRRNVLKQCGCWKKWEGLMHFRLRVPSATPPPQSAPRWSGWVPAWRQLIRSWNCASLRWPTTAHLWSRRRCSKACPCFQAPGRLPPSKNFSPPRSLPKTPACGRLRNL